jgi:hypothetical protein
VIVDKLATFMLDAQSTPVANIELRAQAALLNALGQTTAPIGTGRILSYYSAGVATDLVDHTNSVRWTLTSVVAILGLCRAGGRVRRHACRWPRCAFKVFCAGVSVGRRWADPPCSRAR